jgi:DNA-directed RNA polymerase specialized sigma subunit
MRPMKENKQRPWLTSTGVELATADLREIAKSWDAGTWSSYLKWFESGNRERLVQPWMYDKIGDGQTESIFIEQGYANDPKNQRLCDQLLGQANPLEQRILRQIFFEGRTLREIAAERCLPLTTIYNIKNKALLRLKRGNPGDVWNTCQFMRGEYSSSPDQELSIWDESPQHRLKQDREYDPDNHKAEFEQIKTFSIREALLRPSDTAQRILYLRNWCELPVSQIAKRLGRGVNVIEQIESASISKIKRAALEFELGITLGGE